jgi:hypothetical protein
MSKKWISEFFSALLILLWVYAAISKLRVYSQFSTELLGHDLLKNYAPIIAWLVPAVEIIIAILLIIPRTKKIGFLSSLGLLLVFTFYIIYMFIFYPHKPCSCGGVISTLTWQQHIAFNIFLSIIALLGFWSDRKNRRENANFIPASTT